MSAGSWPCRGCGEDIDIPIEIAMQLTIGNGVRVLRAEQARHLAQCEPYLDALGAKVVAGAEAALREAASA